VRKRLLTIVVLLWACQGQPKHFDVAPAPVTRPGNTSQHSVANSSTGAIVEIRPASTTAPNGSLADCLNNEAVPGDVDAQLALAESFCSGGLAKVWSSVPIVRQSAASTRFGSVHLADPVCLRFVVATGHSLAPTTVSLVDAHGRSLVSNTGHSVIIVPGRGSLCLPKNTDIEFTVGQSNDRGPIRGLLFSSGRVEPIELNK
jgi:hypothetical protein